MESIFSVVNSSVILPPRSTRMRLQTPGSSSSYVETKMEEFPCFA